MIERTWFLSIETWRGTSVGARHWYGRIHQPDERTSVRYPDVERDVYGAVDVERALTAELALELYGEDFDWEGQTTNRFDERRQVVIAALEQWRDLPKRRGWTDDCRLVFGRPAVAHPENLPVLDVM